MKRILSLLLLATLVVPLSWAQQPKRTKRQKVVSFLVGPWKAMVTDWKFGVAIGALAAGVLLDCHSTALVQRRRPGAVELNPFLPEHPTPKQLVAYCGPYFAGQVYASHGLYRYAHDPATPNSKFPIVALAYHVVIGALHGDAARKNYNLVTCNSGFFKVPGQSRCVER